MNNESEDVSYYTENELHEIADSLEKAVTIPVNSEIEAEHRVFDLKEVEKILRESEKIFLYKCGCRTLHNNCDSPLETCISVNVDKFPVDDIEQGDARRVSVVEALDVLKQSHDAGLVHMAYVMKGDEKPFLICSCCPCCCHTLAGVIGHGITTQVLTSRLVAEDLEESNCTLCGLCVDRCVFNARQIEGDKLLYDNTRCFGCGLCVSICPTSNIKLVERA